MVVVMGGMVLAFVLIIGLAGLFHPRSGQDIVGKSLRDHEAEATIEANDIEEMIEARNERRRRLGKPDIGEELAREALRRPPEG
jgi:hypothetical protein